MLVGRQSLLPLARLADQVLYGFWGCSNLAPSTRGAPQLTRKQDIQQSPWQVDHHRLMSLKTSLQIHVLYRKSTDI